MTTLDAESIRAFLRDGEHVRLIRIIEGLPASERDTARVQLALGLSMLRMNRCEESRRTARRLIEREPDLVDAYTLEAAALRALNEVDAAAATLRSGLVRHPGHPALWRLLAELQDTLPAPIDRLALLGRAYATAPGDPRIRRAFSQILAQASGEARFAIAPETALAAADRALQVDQGCGEAWSARLFARQCLDVEPSDSMFDDAVSAGAAHAGGIVPRTWPAHHSLAPLRVGFLACGLHWSSVRHFLAGLFAEHDPAALSIILYDHPPAALDDDYRSLTAGIEVVDASAYSNTDLADRIAEDAIDILVDLVGHGWYGRRLGVLARKPAPVQIAYCGYLGTLGLPTVDWFLSDSAIHPEGGRERYVERLLPMPHWICYRPAVRSPTVADRAKDGPVVFGSFNQIGKISPACLRMWRTAMDAVPASRLLIKRRDLRGYERPFLDRLQFHGLPVDRIDLDARQDRHHDHLSAYGRVDIALDTFPYSGATTVCEALWMGVPVVAMSGATAVSRMSRSVLRAAAHEEWVSDDIEGVAETARHLAEDATARRRFRNHARAQLAETPLLDAARFSRSFEAACRRVSAGGIGLTP